MKKMQVAVYSLVILGIAMVSTAYAGDAMDQLQGMSNTGTTFDGSDGQRSGMDIYVSPSGGNIPEVPEPTPVDTGSSYQPEPAPAPEPVQYEPAPEPPPAETREGTEVAE